MLQLRPYQKECVESLYAWFQKHDGNPLLVLPTAAGKSLIAAQICEDALKWPNQRILVLSHVRELIEQNYRKLMELWPEAPAGVYCAGLNRKQHHHRITVASIQSVHKKANLINWRDLVIIDEAHLLGDADSSMYRSFLSQMLTINPQMKIIGMSATPYRLKSGYLHKGKGALFSDIAYEVPILRLIKEGFLSPLISKAAETQGKTNNLAILGGEFALKEMITTFDKEEMTKAAVSEMLTYGHDRKSWLVFCVSIEHAEHVRNALENRGVDAAMICDKTPKNERDRILADFKAGRIKAITNVSVLTTGFDAPGIDMIVLLRPTMSPGLLVQMAGRGMRLAPGKENCLLLDMAECLVRHGPITHIEPDAGGSRKDKKDREGKVCPKCRTVNALRAMECADCGHIFEGQPRKIKHTMEASTQAAMSSEPRINETPQWFGVQFVKYEIHQKQGAPNSLKAMYKTEASWALEWLAFASAKDFARQKAGQWWRARGGTYPIPKTAEEAMARIDEIARMKVRRIRVRKEGKFTNILAFDLVPAEAKIVMESGNLGQTAVQNA